MPLGSSAGLTPRLDLWVILAICCMLGSARRPQKTGVQDETDAPAFGLATVLTVAASLCHSSHQLSTALSESILPCDPPGSQGVGARQSLCKINLDEHLTTYLGQSVLSIEATLTAPPIRTGKLLTLEAPIINCGPWPHSPPPSNSSSVELFIPAKVGTEIEVLEPPITSLDLTALEVFLRSSP